MSESMRIGLSSDSGSVCGPSSGVVGPLLKADSRRDLRRGDDGENWNASSCGPGGLARRAIAFSLKGKSSERRHPWRLCGEVDRDRDRDRDLDFDFEAPSSASAWLLRAPGQGPGLAREGVRICCASSDSAASGVISIGRIVCKDECMRVTGRGQQDSGLTWSPLRGRCGYISCVRAMPASSSADVSSSDSHGSAARADTSAEVPMRICIGGV